jgi:chromosome segregation ATPase
LSSKNSEIEQLKRALKESEGSVAAMSNQKSKEVEELKYAKMTIESLKQEVEDLKSGRVQSADYETHLQKVRSSYEKTLEKSKEEARSIRQKYDKLQEKCLVIEEQCNQYEIMLSDPDTRCMNSSVRIKDSLDERAIDKEAIEIMREEMQNMAEIISDLKSKNNEWKSMEMQLRQEISELVKEKEDIHADFEDERNELQQKLKDYENQSYTRSKSIRSMENSLQQAREHITYLENEVEKTKASRQEIEILMEMYKKQAEEGKTIKPKPHIDIGVVTSIEDLQEIKRRLESENEKCIEKFEARIKELMVERDNAYEKLENEREDFDLQIMEKNQNIDVLREELKNSKTNRLRLEREIKKNYEDKIKALESELEEARLSTLTNNTRIQNLNDKIENLRDEKKKLESDVQNYKEKLISSTRELQDQLQMYHDLEAQIYSYKQNLMEKSNEIESLKTTLQETERSMTSLSTSRDIDSLKKEFTSIETKYYQTLDELNILKEEMKSHQKESHSKPNNESKLQAQNTYLTQQIVSIEQINQEYLQRIEFLEDKVHYLEEQIRNDEAIIKEYENSKMYEKESSRITHKDVSFERDSLENLKEENDKLVGIISEFKNKSEEWKTIETHLQTKINKLNKDKEEISSKYETEIQELQQRFKELDNQSTNKTRMIDMHLREKINNFEKKIVDQGKEFEAEKEEWAQRMQELENIIREKERDKKELSSKLKEVMNCNSEFENRLKEYTTNLKNLEEDRNKIHKKNLDLQKGTSQKDDKIAELEHRVEELDNANGIQGKSIKRLESSVQQFKDHIAYLEKEIEDLEVAKTESEQLADKLKKQLEETKLLKQNSKSEAGVLAENLHESAKNWDIEKENLIEKYEEQLRKSAKEAEQFKRKLDKQAEDYEFEMNDKNEYITSLKEDLKNLRGSKLKSEREIKDMYESKIIALEQDIEKGKRVSRVLVSPKLAESNSIGTQTELKLGESKDERKQADKLSKRKNSLETSSIYTQTTLDIKQMRTQLKAKFKAEFDSELRKRLQDIMSNYISYKDFDKEVAKKLELAHDEWKTKLNKSDAKHSKKLKETIRGYETKLNEVENEYTNKVAEINLVSEEKIVKLKDFYESKIRNMKEEKEVLAEQLESFKKYKFTSGGAKDGKVHEYKELVAEYDRQLKNISEQYRNYILKTKSCLENAAIEREEHKRTQEMLISKIQSYEQRLQDYEENPLISPEMLSPEETCHLVINIFKRSNKESVITHLLQKNSEFLTLVHEFLEIPYEIAETDHYSQTPSRNLTFIDTAQSHTDCTHDSRPKLALALPLTRLEVPYTENIYTTRSNLTIPRPKSVTEMLPPNVPSTRSLAISCTNRSTKRQP